MDQAAVPAVFNYQPIPAAVGGYYSQAKQPPSNGMTFQAGQWIQIPIVTGRIGQFYDPQRCYFMFQVTMTNAAVTDYLLLERVGGHAFLESVELWLNGQPLEQIQQYNCLMQLIRDQYYGLGRADVCADVEGVASEEQMCWCASNSGFSAAVLKGNGQWGVAEVAATNVPGVVSIFPASVDNAAIANATPQILTPSATVPNAIIAGNTAGATTNSRWFALPILSGLLGTLAAKAFPALVFAPGSLFWQIKLAQPAAVGTRIIPSATATAQAFTFKPYTATDSWQISNFNFVSGAVTLQSGVAATILSAAASGQLDLNTKSFTNVFASMAASTSSTIIVPLRKLSLNSIFVTFRDPNRETGTGTAATGVAPAAGAAHGGFLSRIAPAGTISNTFTSQWRFGNELIREYPYQQSVEFYVEVLRNLHEWFDKELNFCTALTPMRFMAPLAANTIVTGLGDQAYYNPVGGFYGAYATANVIYNCDKPSQLIQNCGFFLALDLDVFSGSSSTSRSGRNTTGDQITLVLNGGAASMFDRTMRVDFFGMHDLRVNIQSGGIAVPVS